MTNYCVQTKQFLVAHAFCVQAHMYRQIEAAGITYVSVGHRQTLRNYHKKILHIYQYDPSRSSEPNWRLDSISPTAKEANPSC